MPACSEVDMGEVPRKKLAVSRDWVLAQTEVKGGAVTCRAWYSVLNIFTMSFTGASILEASGLCNLKLKWIIHHVPAKKPCPKARQSVTLACLRACLPACLLACFTTMTDDDGKRQQPQTPGATTTTRHSRPDNNRSNKNRKQC